MEGSLIYINKGKTIPNRNIHQKIHKKVETNKKNNNLYKKKTLSDVNVPVNDMVTVLNINDNLQRKNRKIAMIPGPVNEHKKNTEQNSKKHNEMFEKYIDEINERMKKVKYDASQKNDKLNIIKEIATDQNKITKINAPKIVANNIPKIESKINRESVIVKKELILIYQNQNMHTEVMGMFIYNFMDCDIHIFLGDRENVSNSIPYYEKIFNKKITYVSDVNEDLYKMIIILTSGEINMVTPIMKNKYLLVNHESATVHREYYNISLTPIVKSNMFLLPVYDHVNNGHRAFIISIIGSLFNHQRDIKNIIKLVQNYTDFKVCIFTRYIDKTTRDTLQKYKNFILYEKVSTDFMVDILRKSRYIYTADTENYTENGVRGGILTGMIPLGLNNNIPIIMTKRLNIIYNLKGVLLYDNDIMELRDIIKNMEHTKYKELLALSLQDKKNRCSENRLKFGLIREKIFNSYIYK